jgi:phospholipid transport system substrate-binding protein
MMKRLVIILTIFHLNIAFAMGSMPSVPNPVQIIDESIADIIDPPGTAALNIMISALSSFKALKKSGKATIQNTNNLIQLKLLPNLAMDVSTELTLKKHWDKLNNQQKKMFKQYITNSLINDYVGMLHSYEELDLIEISVHKKIKRKDNKAIVNLEIKPNEQARPVQVSLKMIRTNKWRVYDVIFSGVSLMKNYRAQFNSHIRRKGIDSLIDKITKKLK